MDVHSLAAACLSDAGVSAEQFHVPDEIRCMGLHAGDAVVHAVRYRGNEPGPIILRPIHPGRFFAGKPFTAHGVLSALSGCAPAGGDLLFISIVLDAQ